MRLTVTILAVALFAGLAAAQTTGIPGWNDYTINGATSGSTSCNTLTFVQPTPLTFDVSTAGPSTTVYLVFSPGPCQANSWGGGCAGTTFDLQFGWPFDVVLIPTAATGIASISVFLQSYPPFCISTQAVIIDQVACPGQVLFTQAYDVKVS